MSRWEMASVLLCTTFFSAWNIVSTGTFSFGVVVFFLLFSLFCQFTGKLLVRLFPSVVPGAHDFNLHFLLGFVYTNCTVFVLQCVSPFGIRANCVIVVVLTIMVALKARSLARHAPDAVSPPGESPWPALLALVLVLTATSCWSYPDIDGIVNCGATTIFRPWIDCFYHAYQIANMEFSNGVWTLNNLQLSGVSAPFYHYATYVMPAALCSVSATTAMQSYCSYLGPFGLFISGLAAFSFVKSNWSGWAGFWACVALFLIPDAAQLGFGNRWLSYHWLTQTAPAVFYCIALMCIAWMLMIQGCRKGMLSLVLVSYFLTVFSINFKSHVFFANALIVMIYPSFYYCCPAGNVSQQRLRMLKAGWFLFSALVFVLAVRLTQEVPYLPLIRFDGSAAGHYMSFVISCYDDVWLKGFLTGSTFMTFLQAHGMLWHLFMGSFLFLGTFGIYGILYLVMMGVVDRVRGKYVVLLPFMFILYYLVMALGLAYDAHGIGTPEELLHRPLVWHYFFVCICAAGSLAHYWQQKYPAATGDKRRRAYHAAMAVGVLLLFIVQVGYSYESRGGPFGQRHINTKVPTGIVSASCYIRENSRRGDIIQDSRYDPYGFLTALSERQSFVCGYFTKQFLPLQKSRIESLEQMKNMSSRQDIEAFFVSNNISFYLLNSGDTVRWPDNLLDKCVYESSGYKVFSRNSLREGGVSSSGSTDRRALRPAGDGT